MRPSAAALLMACLATGAPEWAACARAQAAVPFEEVRLRRPPGASHRAAWVTAIAGASLVAVSFPLAAAADRRYDVYLNETDPPRIDERYDATVRMDRLASASLLAGEGLMLAAVWLRFVHRPPLQRVSLNVEPGRCAVSLRF